MTYIEMVNNVLRRLRERTVSNVSDNEYSSLIGIFINDAKREIEEAWDWSALRTTLSATTTADVYSYELNGSNNNIKMLDVLNDTDDFFMRYVDSHWMNKMFLAVTPERGSPFYYNFNGVSSDGDVQVDIFPIPDDVYTLRFNCLLRTEDLSGNTDQLLIPAQPVLMLAYAKAVEERGEDGGVGVSSAYATANRSLNDAISYDAARHPEELIWKTI